MIYVDFCKYITLQWENFKLLFTEFHFNPNYILKVFSEGTLSKSLVFSLPCQHCSSFGVQEAYWAVPPQFLPAKTHWVSRSDATIIFLNIV